jgi:hypothetical protein
MVTGVVGDAASPSVGGAGFEPAGVGVGAVALASVTEVAPAPSPPAELLPVPLAVPPPPLTPPPTPLPPVAALGIVTGTEVDDGAPAPALFVATTVKEYESPSVRPVTVIGLLVPFAVAPPGDAVTV